MNVQRMQVALWTLFVAFSILAIPIGGIALGSDDIPHPLGVAIAVGAGVLWWGSFAYAMYLVMVAVKNGDRRLLKRGIHGTAVITSAKVTNETINGNDQGWGGDQVYKYGLQVTLPGDKTYATSCSICSYGLQVGQTVPVAASKWNKARVTIDVGQGKTKGTVPDAIGAFGGGSATPAGTKYDATGRLHLNVPGDPLSDPAMADIKHLVDGLRENIAHGAPPTQGLDLGHAQVFVSGQQVSGQALGRHAGSNGETERVEALAKLSALHDSGALTDAEFASEKARLLGPT